MEFNKNQTGLTLAAVFGLLHLSWVLAVGLGLGQRLLDWTHSIHFLTSTFAVSGFSLSTALIGIIGAVVCGYIIGWLFAAIWNWFEKK